MKPILVIHHSADLDGICSREVAKRNLGDDADYVGWDYGQPVPDLEPYKEIIVVDIRLTEEVMRKYANKIIWIDHHKSSIESMKDVKFLDSYCIDGVAACRLIYQYFHTHRDDRPDKAAFVDRKVEEPYAVQLLGEFDIWDKRNPNTDLFQLGMQAETSADWSVLLSMSFPNETHFKAAYVSAILGRGKAINAYTTMVNAQIIVERGFDVTFEGLKFRALNIARCNSMTFTAAIKPEHEGCLAYFWNGQKWRFSLYQVEHRKDIDLSVIAVKNGGGGHRGACGFELERLPICLGGSE